MTRPLSDFADARLNRAIAYHVDQAIADGWQALHRERRARDRAAAEGDAFGLAFATRQIDKHRLALAVLCEIRRQARIDQDFERYYRAWRQTSGFGWR